MLDLSSRVGAYCGKLLADLGADVIKVERPAGDRLRRTPPFRRDAPDGETGLLFAWYNNNKRGITLDWTRSDAVPLLSELASSVDVVIVSPDPREQLATFEEAPPHLAWVPHGTTLCAITPFGLTGPWRQWRATPFTTFASSGQMHAVGPDEGPPRAMPGQQLYDQASTRAATMVVAILAGDVAAQTIDVSAQEVGAWQYHVIQRFDASGRILTRATNFGPPPGVGLEVQALPSHRRALPTHHWVEPDELLGSPDDRWSLFPQRHASAALRSPDVHHRRPPGGAERVGPGAARPGDGPAVRAALPARGVPPGTRQPPRRGALSTSATPSSV